jgi:TetR/AcrR family transcriptional regulator, regulator of cefoperazone and chloramphenicol sensitivity
VTAPRRPATGSQARADRSREVVIEHAVRCILEDGFTPPSVRRITGKAGVTWGVVQYHFGDRDGLLMAVVDRGFAELLERLRSLPPASGDQTRRKRVELVVHAAWEAFSSPTSRASLEILIGTRAMRDKRATRHLVELQRAITDLSGDIAEGLDSPHAAAVGDLIWATMRGLVITQLVMAGPIPTSRELTALVDVICSYLDRHGQTQ